MMSEDQAEIIIETFQDSHRKEQPLWTLHKSPQWTQFYKHWWIEGSDRISDEASRVVTQPDVRRLLGLPEHITLPNSELIKSLEATVKGFPDGIAVLGPDATTIRSLFLYRVARQLPSYFSTTDLKSYRVNELGVSIKNTDEYRFEPRVYPQCLPHLRP